MDYQDRLRKLGESAYTKVYPNRQQPTHSFRVKAREARKAKKAREAADRVYL